MFLCTFCNQQQFDEEALAEKINTSDSTIKALVNNTRTEITQNIGDTIYSARTQFILESARFRLDSLRHSIDKYTKETFQLVDTRLEQIIYQTEQELLELKEVTGRNTNSFYDDFAGDLENS